MRKVVFLGLLLVFVLGFASCNDQSEEIFDFHPSDTELGTGSDDGDKRNPPPK